MQGARIFGPTQPPSVETIVYTVGTGNTHTKLLKMEIVVANTGLNESSFGLSLVAVGYVAGLANRLIPDVKIPSGSLVSFSFNQVLTTGEYLSVKQTGSLTITISGVVE